MVKKIDTETLAEAIKTLKRGTRLYITLKKELSLIGHWKLKARGKADKGRFNGKDNK